MPDHTGPPPFNASHNRKLFLRAFVLIEAQQQTPTASSNNKAINIAPIQMVLEYAIQYGTR